jgi:CRP/FNR family transcriptional regulator
MNIEELSRCFANLYPEELEKIGLFKKQILYSKSELIFKQGAFAHHVFFIIDGIVKTYIQTDFEKQLNIKIATTGEFLAFNTVYGEKYYQYSASAIRNSTICMIEKDALQKLILSNPDFAYQINSRNMYDENRMLEIIRNISYKQMRGKLASTLLYIYEISQKSESIFPLLTRQDLAEFASINTESAIKILKEFEQEYIIELINKDIVIKSPEKLDEISRKG